jgi:hypothetical protein
MTRSKRFRKRQTQRKTKRIIVGGVKKSREVKIDISPVPKYDFTQITKDALAASIRAAADKAQDIFHSSIQARAHAERTKAEAQAAYINAKKAKEHAERIAADAARSDEWAKSNVPSKKMFHELREGNKAVVDAAQRAAHFAADWAERKTNVWHAALDWAKYRAEEASKAAHYSDEVKTHAQKVAPFLTRHAAPPPSGNTVVYSHPFVAPDALVAPTSSVANTTRSANIPLDLTRRHLLPLALNQGAAPPPSGNVLSELTANTAEILAKLKSQAAPHASALPSPPLKWRRKGK